MSREYLPRYLKRVKGQYNLTKGKIYETLDKPLLAVLDDNGKYWGVEITPDDWVEVNKDTYDSQGTPQGWIYHTAEKLARNPDVMDYILANTSATPSLVMHTLDNAEWFTMDVKVLTQYNHPYEVLHEAVMKEYEANKKFIFTDKEIEESIFKQPKEKPMKQYTPIKIEHTTLIDDDRICEFSDSQIISFIAEEKAQAKMLKDLDITSVNVKEKILKHEENVVELIKILDAR
jgi:hypothetical protein